MGRIAASMLALLALAGTPHRPRINQTVSNGDGTLSAWNMGDQVVFNFDEDPRAQIYYLQIARTYNGRWTTLGPYTPLEIEHHAGLVDALDCVPGRFMPDLTQDHPYYRLLLVNDAGRVFRIYPPVRVPPWMDEHPEESSTPIDPGTPVTEMNAVDPSEAATNEC